MEASLKFYILDLVVKKKTQEGIWRMRFLLWLLSSFGIMLILLLLFKFYIVRIFPNINEYRFIIEPLIFSLSPPIATYIYYQDEIKNKKGIIEYLEEWDKKRIAADREKK